MGPTPLSVAELPFQITFPTYLFLHLRFPSLFPIHSPLLYLRMNCIDVWARFLRVLVHLYFAWYNRMLRRVTGKVRQIFQLLFDLFLSLLVGYQIKIF